MLSFTQRYSARTGDTVSGWYSISLHPGNLLKELPQKVLPSAMSKLGWRGTP